MNQVSRLRFNQLSSHLYFQLCVDFISFRMSWWLSFLQILSHGRVPEKWCGTDDVSFYGYWSVVQFWAVSLWYFQTQWDSNSVNFRQSQIIGKLFHNQSGISWVPGVFCSLQVRFLWHNQYLSICVCCFANHMLICSFLCVQCQRGWNIENYSRCALWTQLSFVSAFCRWMEVCGNVSGWASFKWYFYISKIYYAVAQSPQTILNLKVKKLTYSNSNTIKKST